jgi:hypothetical protein
MIMKQISINEFRRTRYNTDSAPDPRTIRKWIDNGLILGGRKSTGKYYVEIDPQGREISPDEYGLMNHA